MSTLQVTTITTVNNTTPLILQTGNTGGGQIVLESANNDVLFNGNMKFSNTSLTGDMAFTGNASFTGTSNTHWMNFYDISTLYGNGLYPGLLINDTLQFNSIGFRHGAVKYMTGVDDDGTFFLNEGIIRSNAAASGDSYYGISNYLEANTEQALGSVIGNYNITRYTSNSTISNIYCGYNAAQFLPTGSGASLTTLLAGSFNTTQYQPSSNNLITSIASSYGSYNLSNLNNLATRGNNISTVGNSYGVYSIVGVTCSNATSKVYANNVYGVYSSLNLNNVGGVSISNNVYNIYAARGANTGNVVNSYGVYVQTPARGDSVTYGMYVEGGNTYFGGPVGIGTATPNSTLHLSSTSRTYISITANSKDWVIDHRGTFDSGSNALSFAYDGTERMRINSAGYVGIGTSNPVSILNISGASLIDNTGASGKWTARLRDTTSMTAGVGAGILLQGSKTAGGAAGNFAAIAGLKENSTESDESGYLAFYTTPNSTQFITERMRITSGGSLGLGTSSPSYLLHVANGSIAITSSSGAGTFQITDDSDSSRGLLLKSNHGGSSNTYVGTNSAIRNLVFGIDHVERMRLDTSGNLGIGTSSPGTTLDVSVAAASFQVSSTTGTNRVFGRVVNGSGNFYFGIDSSTGGLFGNGNYSRNIYSDGAYPMVFVTNSSERMRLHASGGVSIGNTTDPGATNLSVTGTIADSAGVHRPRILSTTQATTSGTVKDFTSIPSWVTKITVMFNQVSTNGGSAFLVQIGTGGAATTSGYASYAAFAQISASATGGTTSTSGFVMHHTLSSYTMTGLMTISYMGSNVWVASGVLSNSTYSTPFAGVVTLGGTLNFLRVTSATPDTFNGGSVNIIYE